MSANQAAADAQQCNENAEADSRRDRLAAANSDQQQQLRNFGIAERFRASTSAVIILLLRAAPQPHRQRLSDNHCDLQVNPLRPMAREKLAENLQLFSLIRISGLPLKRNTDSVGSDAADWQLSESRANSVRSFLAAKYSRRLPRRRDSERRSRRSGVERHGGRRSAESPCIELVVSGESNDRNGCRSGNASSASHNPSLDVQHNAQAQVLGPVQSCQCQMAGCRSLRIVEHSAPSSQF